MKVHPSALKHGISAEDALQASEWSLWVEPLSDDEDPRRELRLDSTTTLACSKLWSSCPKPATRPSSTPCLPGASTSTCCPSSSGCTCPLGAHHHPGVSRGLNPAVSSEATGQRLEPDRAELVRRVVDDDRWCRRLRLCGRSPRHICVSRRSLPVGPGASPHRRIALKQSRNAPHQGEGRILSRLSESNR